MELLKDIAGRWQRSGVSPNAVKQIESGDAFAVVQAFDEVLSTAAGSTEVLYDLISVVEAGVPFSDAESVWQGQRSTLSKVFRTKPTDRKTTATDELVRVILAADGTGPRGADVAKLVRVALANEAKLNEAQQEQLICHAVGTLGGEHAGQILQSHCKLMQPAPEAVIAKHVRVIGAAIGRSMQAASSAAVAMPDSGKEQLLEHVVRLFVSIGPAIRHDTAVSAAFREDVFPQLLRAATSGTPKMVRLAFGTFSIMLTSARGAYGDEIDSLFHALILPMLGNAKSNTQNVILALEEIRPVCAEAQHLVDLYINFDCKPGRRRCVLPLWNAITETVATHSDEAVRRTALCCIADALHGFAQWMDRFEDRALESAEAAAATSTTNCESPEPEADTISAAMQLKRATESAMADVNAGRVDAALRRLQGHASSGVTSANDFGKWLYANNHLLSKLAIGEFFGKLKPERQEALTGFTQSHNFAHMTIDEALRVFLGGFKLVGEAQVVDSTMNVFATHYCHLNPGTFRSDSTAFVLAFSICMLNTDAHSVNVKSKMSCQQFIKNNAGIDDGEDLPVDLMQGVYARVTQKEIRLRMGPADHLAASAVNAARSGSSSMLKQLPVLRHLAPVVGLVTDVVLLPMELAASVTGIAESQERRRADAEFNAELQTIVQDTVSALKVRAGQQTESMTMATSLQHILPMIRDCLDGAVRAVTSCLRRAADKDEEFDVALRSAKIGVHVCCRVGEPIMAIQFAAALAHFVTDFASGTSALQPRHGNSIRTLYEMTLHNGDLVPPEMWMILWRSHALLVGKRLLDPNAPPPDDVQGKAALEIFEKQRKCIHNALSQQLRARLRNSAKLTPNGRLAMARGIIAFATENKSAEVANEYAELLAHHVKQAAPWVTRLQWHQLWTAAAPILLEAVVRRPDFASRLTMVAESIVTRAEFAQHQEQADTMRVYDTAWGMMTSEGGRQSVVAEAMRVVERHGAQLTSGWRPVFKLIARLAHSSELAAYGAQAARKALEQLKQTPTALQSHAVDCVACLLGYACAPGNAAIGRECLKLAATLTEVVVTPPIVELFVSVAGSSGISVAVRCEALQIAAVAALRANVASGIVALSARLIASCDLETRALLADFVAAAAFTLRGCDGVFAAILSQWAASDSASSFSSLFEHLRASSLPQWLFESSARCQCGVYLDVAVSNLDDPGDAASSGTTHMTTRSIVVAAALTAAPPQRAEPALRFYTGVAALMTGHETAFGELAASLFRAHQSSSTGLWIAACLRNCWPALFPCFEGSVVLEDFHRDVLTFAVERLASRDCTPLNGILAIAVLAGAVRGGAMLDLQLPPGTLLQLPSKREWDAWLTTDAAASLAWMGEPADGSLYQAVCDSLSSAR